MYFAIEGNKMAVSDTVKLFKAADHLAKNIRAFNDDGSVFNLTGSTLTLEVYTDATRTTSVKSLACVLGGTPTGGAATVTVAPAGASFGPGKYVAFLKSDIAGVVNISKNYVTLVAG